MYGPSSSSWYFSATTSSSHEVAGAERPEQDVKSAHLVHLGSRLGADDWQLLPKPVCALEVRA